MYNVIAHTICLFIKNAKKRSLVFDILTNRNNIGESATEIIALNQTIDNIRSSLNNITKIQQNIHSSLNNIIETQRSIINNQDLSLYKNELFFFSSLRHPNENELECRKRFFRSLQTADRTLNNIQVANNYLLIEFDKFCRKNNISYFISFGTLLGAVRHGHNIPWDDDVDIIMTREQFKKLKCIFNSKVPNTFSLRDFYGVDSGNFCFVHRLMFNQDIPNFVDIFIVDYISKDVVEYKKELLKLRAEMLAECINKNLFGFHDPLISPEICLGLQGIFDKYFAEINSFITYQHTMDTSVCWGFDNFTSDTAFYHKATDIFPLTELEFAGEKLLAPHNYKLILNTFYGDIYTFPRDLLTHKHIHLSSNQNKVLESVVTTILQDQSL